MAFTTILRDCNTITILKYSPAAVLQVNIEIKWPGRRPATPDE